MATGGSGVLPAGAIHPDLVNRLAHEAAKSAQHVLTMCIRALDYCPPTDLTFGEFLRAVITADVDLVPHDDRNYRVAFIEAFRKRGIYPRDLATLSVESLLWRGPQEGFNTASGALDTLLGELRGVASDFLYAESRYDVFKKQREMRRLLHAKLSIHFGSGQIGRRDAEFLGLIPPPAQAGEASAKRRSGHRKSAQPSDEGAPSGRGGSTPAWSFEVHTARIAMRPGADGFVRPQLMLGLLQRQEALVDSTRESGPTMMFEGGCTIVADLQRLQIQYCIRKNLNSYGRRERQRAFLQDAMKASQDPYLRAPGMDDGHSEPFAALHRGH